MTAAAMFRLTAGNRGTGRAFGDRVLTAEGRVTLIDAILALAVLTGISLKAVVGWWWTDPAVGLVILYYGAREAHHIFTTHEDD